MHKACISSRNHIFSFMSVSSQVQDCPLTVKTRGFFFFSATLTLWCLSWEVPSWGLSVSPWHFLTFSSPSWGFGAHVQCHQILPVHWGKDGEGQEGGAQASRGSRHSGAVQGRGLWACHAGDSNKSQTLGTLTEQVA